MKSLILLLALLSSSTTFAFDEMADASRFASEMKRIDARPHVLALDGARHYKKGDRWAVAVTHKSHPFVRKVDGVDKQKDIELAPELYSFEVLDVGGGLSTIEVRPPGDSRIEKVVLTIDESLRIRSKQYYRKGASTVIETKSQSKSNVATGFDAFPLALPDFGRLVNAHTSLDLFSRPVRFTWKRGEPWPSRVETSSSVSVLTKQELMQ